MERVSHRATLSDRDHVGGAGRPDPLPVLNPGSTVSHPAVPQAVALWAHCSWSEADQGRLFPAVTTCSTPM